MPDPTHLLFVTAAGNHIAAPTLSVTLIAQVGSRDADEVIVVVNDARYEKVQHSSLKQGSFTDALDHINT